MSSSANLAASACASCLIGNTAVQLLTYPAATISTVTVEVIPHVTVYPGDRSVTSYESVTNTVAALSAASSLASGSQSYSIFSHSSSLTWTVGDATLTYPTTYLQYLGFDGAVRSSTTCANDVSPFTIEIPSTANLASFIYPSASRIDNLPEPMLQYMQGLPQIAALFPGLPLTACGLLTTTPVSGSGPSTSVPAIPMSTTPPSSPTPPPTSSERSSTSDQSTHTRLPGNSTRASPNSSTRGGPVHSAPSSSPPSLTSKMPWPPEKHPSRISENTKVQQSTETVTLSPQTHTTAYIITTVTGRPIITSASKVSIPRPTLPDITTAPQIHTTNNLVSNKEQLTPNQGPTTVKQPDPQGSQTKGQSSTQQEPTDKKNGNPNVPTPPTTTGQSEVQHGSSPTTKASSPPQSPLPDITTRSNGQIVYGGHTLTPGQSITLGSGESTTVIAIQTTHGSAKLQISHPTLEPQPTPPTTGISEAVITTNGHTITAIHSGSSLVLEDGRLRTTAKLGTTVTFEGETVHAGSSGNGLEINGHRTTFIRASPTPFAIVTAKGHTFTALRKSGHLVLEDEKSTTTLQRGVKSLVFDSATVQIVPSGTQSVLVVNGRSAPLTGTWVQTALPASRSGGVHSPPSAGGSAPESANPSSLAVGRPRSGFISSPLSWLAFTMLVVLMVV